MIQHFIVKMKTVIIMSLMCAVSFLKGIVLLLGCIIVQDQDILLQMCIL